MVLPAMKWPYPDKYVNCTNKEEALSANGVQHVSFQAGSLMCMASFIVPRATCLSAIY